MTFLLMLNPTTEAVAQRYYMEKVFLEISQNSQEDTCGLRPATLLKRDFGAGVFL